MISLFKPNDPIRLFLGILLFLLMFVPLIWFQLPTTENDILYSLIGNKINEGSFMYKDIWDYTGLFTSLTYSGITYSRYTSLLASLIPLLVLIFVGVKITLNFNTIEVYPRKNFLTIYFFIIGIFGSFLILKFSSQLFSVLFISLGLNIVLKHFSSHIHDEERILLGFWHGIASLYFFPSTLFFVLHLLFFAAYTKLRFSSYLLSLFGFIIPYFFIGIVYYTQGSLADFINRAIIYYFQFNFRTGLSFENYLILIAPVAVSILISFFCLLSQFHNNIESTTKALMMMWFVCFIIISFWTNFDAYNCVFLCIPFAYFCTYMFLVLKNKYMYRFLAFCIPVYIVGSFWLDFSHSIRQRPEKAVIVEKSKFEFSNKKILILGNDLAGYYNQKLATKYLYWPMAQKQIRKINSFAGLTMIYTSISEDWPDVIVDELHLMPKLQSQIPVLGELYKQNKNNIYYLNK
ncbi:MAG: hypothetical protein U0V72_03650 [Cytophagales bacterium]